MVKKKVAWPLSKKKQKITNNKLFLKLFFPKGSDHPQGNFFIFFCSRVLKKKNKIKNATWGGLSLSGQKSFNKGILFVIFWF